MRLLVLLLLLLNVGLFAYFNMGQLAPAPVSASREINPEKLIILNQQALDAMPNKQGVTVEATPAPASIPAASPAVSDLAASTCYKWGNFTKTNLPAAQVVLARLGLQNEVKQEEVATEESRFWVYYPPLKSAELAQKKAAEIKALGVEELYIVQDTQWRNAISFGIFQDEQLASGLLNDLHTKGVKNATKALRSTGKSLNSLLIKAVSAETAIELHKVKPEFVGTELMPTACPAI
jgi:hypothetical protein